MATSAAAGSLLTGVAVHMAFDVETPVGWDPGTTYSSQFALISRERVSCRSHLALTKCMEIAALMKQLVLIFLVHIYF